MNDRVVPRALVIMSGGIDSTTALHVAMARHGRSRVEAISFDYGQMHLKELDMAAKTCAHEAIPHTLQKLHLPASAISSSESEVARSEEIPNVGYDEILSVSPTYVPFRNGTFISTAAAVAADRAKLYDRPYTLYIGTHAEDAAHDAYPDCRLDFIGGMAAAIYIGTYHQVKLSAPFIEHSKDQIIQIGDDLGTEYSFTWSCYRGMEYHCGVCPTCRARKEAFMLAGVKDPTEYADQMLNIP